MCGKDREKKRYFPLLAVFTRFGEIAKYKIRERLGKQRRRGRVSQHRQTHVAKIANSRVFAHLWVGVIQWNTKKKLGCTKKIGTHDKKKKGTHFFVCPHFFTCSMGQGCPLYHAILLLFFGPHRGIADTYKITIFTTCAKHCCVLGLYLASYNKIKLVEFLQTSDVYVTASIC